MKISKLMYLQRVSFSYCKPLWIHALYGPTIAIHVTVEGKRDFHRIVYGRWVKVVVVAWQMGDYFNGGKAQLITTVPRRQRIQT